MPAKRTYGMDQDYYAWSPIVSRPVLKWPGGARVAVAVMVDLEFWDWGDAADFPQPVSPLGGAEGLWTGNGRFPDIGGWGNHEYGNRVGIFRVLSVLEKYGIRPSIAMDKTVADNYPYLVDAGKKAKAEFIAHGISRRQAIHGKMTVEQEKKYIRDSIDALTKATGSKPAGWLSPDYQETIHTPALLAAEGIKYVCDWGNDEQPYKMNVPQGELYSIGPSNYLDDDYIHLHGRRTINEVNLLWRDWFDGLYADGAKSGRMMVFNLHPWIIGQPWRIRHLDEVLGHISSHGAVWKATTGEIMDAFKAQEK